MKKQQLVRDEWRVLSDKFVKHHRLPHGTRLVLEHRAPAPGARARKARNDTTFTRRLFHGRAGNTETVSDLINTHLLPYLTVSPLSKGLNIRLVGPNNEVVKKPGATRIRRVRAWTPQPTSDEVEQEERLEAEIEEISDLADVELRQAEELRDDSDRVLRGYIRALKRRYGSHAFGEAVKEES
jgi:hypothetical protein